MGDAGGQLANRLHFVRLVKCPLALQATSAASATRRSSVWEFKQFGVGPLCSAARFQKLSFIAAAVGRIEDGDADEPQIARFASPLRGVDEDRKGRSIRQTRSSATSLKNACIRISGASGFRSRFCPRCSGNPETT
ncbi:hypothetical protein EN974_18220 [Mesorhizobium sp. M7A.F.Ca.CA.001.12.2.1]|uniref:hypothetical protein n=1 Tax=unclassified Mesorhizobium TaxID=325217 RepID=UPI000FCA5877|nr:MULTISPECIES: hypothetical protein [unclassified Mesorhizobium]RUY97077.1 hypothetical protein EN974_18220 [Mesorhizobium sp. M7A.F.Ca.CA.001.12.2.1]RUZ14194.1 hypothetical protein EN949_33850 [Mesorhizobium sp. M7A.F.Ca.US.007.01.2.1]RUZ81328.1 hypothetical protein EN947_19590 [Mesorhizobium sp. M7A.F.Ca.US.003.02.2.1]